LGGGGGGLLPPPPPPNGQLFSDARMSTAVNSRMPFGVQMEFCSMLHIVLRSTIRNSSSVDTSRSDAVLHLAMALNHAIQTCMESSMHLLFGYTRPPLLNYI